MAHYKENIIPHKHKLTRLDRNIRLNHLSKVIWFTGLSGSGKSTLANVLELNLSKKGYNTYILDGDNIRKGLTNDLDFSDASRKENIRRIGEVTKLFIDAGLVVLTAFISPFKNDRLWIRELVGVENFIEVYVNCSLEKCEKRDAKGLYQKARKGVIKNFTGIDSPFEIPLTPNLVIDTEKNSLENSLKVLVEYIEPKLKL